MVQRFPAPRRNLRKVIYYNETKVAAGQARYILAANFNKEIHEMSAEEKIEFLKRRNALRTSCKANTPHITLSFDPSEQLSDAKLGEIAQTYMERIGFGDQPYLVYRHLDTGHPHLHIVTTLVTASGERIATHEIGERLCEPARRELEILFDLVKADGRRRNRQNTSETSRPRKINYGSSEIYRSISGVIDTVLKTYNFTTVGEYNAILKQFNVFAETGKKGTKTYQNGGLYYRATDDKGIPHGVPIKASELPGKPTLKSLRACFERNALNREEALESLRIRIAWVLSRQPRSLDEFVSLLADHQIKSVLWKNASGWTYGITFIDLKTLTAVNGRTIGKELSASAIQEKFNNLDQNSSPKEGAAETPTQQEKNRGYNGSRPPKTPPPDQSATEYLLDLILRPIPQDERVPFELTGKKVKRRNNRSH